jgi:hypothetical protein
VTIKSRVLSFAGVGALAVAAFTAAGASPASASAPFFPCTKGGHAALCAPMLVDETLWEANNKVNRTIFASFEVAVECWYTGGGPGTPKDGIWDHVIWTNDSTNLNGALVIGHLDDNGVDFDGFLPSQEDLPHCS